VAVYFRDEIELTVSTKCTEILVFHVSVIQFIMQGNYSPSGKLLLIGTVSAACKGQVHSCTGTEALYRPYGPQG